MYPTQFDFHWIFHPTHFFYRYKDIRSPMHIQFRYPLSALAPYTLPFRWTQFNDGCWIFLESVKKLILFTLYFFYKDSSSKWFKLHFLSSDDIRPKSDSIEYIIWSVFENYLKAWQHHQAESPNFYDPLILWQTKSIKTCIFG